MQVQLVPVQQAEPPVWEHEVARDRQLPPSGSRPQSPFCALGPQAPQVPVPPLGLHWAKVMVFPPQQGQSQSEPQG
jgi:hypothetical protein